MASYRFSPPFAYLSGGVMTGTSVISSTRMDISTITNVAFELTWTGTPNGTFQVLASLTGNNWADLGVPIDPAVGSADTRVINLTGLSFKWVKIQYTNTSSTGALTVYGCSKTS